MSWKLALLVAAGLVAGVLFGVVPCYLFPPLFGTQARAWCGGPTAPPFFRQQFVTGALVSLAPFGYLLFGGLGRPRDR